MATHLQKEDVIALVAVICLIIVLWVLLYAVLRCALAGLRVAAQATIICIRAAVTCLLAPLRCLLVLLRWVCGKDESHQQYECQSHSGQNATTLNSRLHRLANDLRPSASRSHRGHRELVDDFKREFLQGRLRHICRDVGFVGGSYEGAGIPGDSDYDLQFYYKLDRRVTASSAVDSDWVQVYRYGETLTTSEILQKVQSAVDTAMWNQSGLSFRVSGRARNGPAITVRLSRGGISVSVDIVVYLSKLDIEGCDRDVVAKPYSWTDNSKWRMSSSIEEKEKMRSYLTEAPMKLDLYKIMKYLRKRHPQLNSLPGYFYKNVIFHMTDSSWSWTRDQFADRFIELLGDALQALVSGYLPMYFNSRVNLAAKISYETRRNVVGFLERVQRTDRYMQLFE